MAAINVHIIKINEVYTDCHRDIECKEVKSLGVKEIPIPLPPPIPECELVDPEVNPATTMKVEIIRSGNDLLYIEYTGASIIKTCVDNANAAAAAPQQVVIEAYVGGAFSISGTDNVTGIANGSSTVTSTDLAGKRVRVIRGNMPLPGLDPGDGSAYITKVLASTSVTFHPALNTGEYIRIETIN